MQHPGTVTSVKKGFVTVQITSLSACAACQAHSKCGFAESKTKTLDIPTALWQQFNVGEPVTVTIDHSRGLAATWWAYILPAILLIAAVVAFSLAGFSEPLVILFSLFTLGLYILLLYILRKKLDSKFTLTITHNS
jgi:sigma-E factor negative regulatory protein RseC